MERLVISYYAMVNQMLKHLSELADTGNLDVDGNASLSPDMFEYAKAAYNVNDFSCLPLLTGGNDFAGNPLSETIRAEFSATYGIFIAQAVSNREPKQWLSEIETAGLLNVLNRAAYALHYAIPILKEQVNKQKEVGSTAPLETRLFFLSDQQAYLARAEAKLQQIENRLTK